MCILQRKSFILNYVYDGLIVSHKQETVTSLIEALNNGPEKYMFTDKVDTSNYIGVNTKKNNMGHSNHCNLTW